MSRWLCDQIQLVPINIPINSHNSSGIEGQSLEDEMEQLQKCRVFQIHATSQLYTSVYAVRGRPVAGSPSAAEPSVCR
jgi:hypothetical protein